MVRSLVEDLFELAGLAGFLSMVALLARAAGAF